jgi:predicted nuclease of predicted toxin-antitoxin system
LLFDEQTSREVARRLSELCDVERVVTVPELGAGADDDEIRTYAVENDRNVVTEGPDFIDGSAGPGASTYPKVIFCTDRSSEAIDDAIRELGRFYSTEDRSDRENPVYVPGQRVD